MVPLLRRRMLAAGAGLAGGLGWLASARAQGTPQPQHGSFGGTDPGPRDAGRDAENPDLLNPPRTDHGLLPNLRFSFDDAHVRQTDDGWTREVTVRELPVSKTIAGVDMRLNRGAVRELHWHKEAEWAFMLYGTARITAVDQLGRNFVADVNPGDLWYFPSGIPHSIQGIGDDGCEFLLVFDDGGFSEDSTFLISDWFKHTPPEVLGKNFGVDPKNFANLPSPSQRYIFPLSVPGPLGSDQVAGKGAPPEPFTFRLMDVAPIQTKFGSVRIADASNFKVSKTIAAALVEVEPGGMRELHWHPNADEWQYYVSGTARMTVFAGSEMARTFDYRAGDVGYVPFAMGHYIENTGDTVMRYLEIFRAPGYEDVSLAQWMALTPPELVQGTLNLPGAVMTALQKEKRPVV